MRQLLLICIIAVLCASKALGQIPVPTGLSAEVISTDSINFVSLTWNDKSVKDSLTVGYNVLSNYPPHDDLMISQKVGVVYDTTYLFPISNARGATYRFAVVGLSNFPTIQRSEMSMVVEILVPSTQIPYVHLNKVKRDKQRLILNWEYPDSIEDLEGFKILLNDEVVTMVEATKREIEYPVKGNGSYIFQIQAYTKNIESKPSQSRLIKVQK